MSIEVNCVTCDELLYRQLNKIKRNKHHFCNARCYGQWRSKFAVGENSSNWNGGKVKINCDACGKETEKTPSALKRGEHHYCNKECADRGKSLFNRGGKYWRKRKGRRVEVDCDNCGKGLSRIPARIKRNKNHFCDSKCYGEWKSINQRGQNHPNWTRRKVTCNFCGQEREIAKCRETRHDDHYCDMECYDAFLTKTGRVKTNCAFCDEILVVTKTRARDHERQYCNAECRNKGLSLFNNGENNPLWKRVKTKCTYCGKEHWRTASESRRTVNPFCKAECYWDWMHFNHMLTTDPRDFTQHYGPDYDRQRKKAISRSGNKCEITGQTLKQLKKNGNTLHVHHIIKFSSFGWIPGENTNYIQANDLNNLIVVASNVHRAVEAGAITFQPHMM